jgi:hypothetical protein
MVALCFSGLCCGRQRQANGACWPAQEVTALATPNYSYEKRQRELAKKRKAEEKRQKKSGRVGDGPADEAAGGAPVEPGGGANPAPPPSPAE